MLQLFMNGQLIEQIKIDGDGFIMQFFIVDSRFADPISSLRLQKEFEDVAKGLAADDFLNKIIVVFLTLQQGVVCADGLPNELSLEHAHLFGFQKRDKSFTEIFGNILSVSQMVLFTFLAQTSSSHFFENIHFLSIGFVLSIVLVAIIGGSSIFLLSGKLFYLVHRLIFWHVKRVCILDGVNLILIDNFGNFFNCVTVHFAEMVLYFQFRGGVVLQQGKMEAVLILPINAIEVKLFLGEDALGDNALLAHHLKLIRRVHLQIIIIIQYEWVGIKLSQTNIRERSL